MIKALIFDFGNVFLNLGIEKSMKDTLKSFQLDSFSEEMYAINYLYEQGLLSTDEFLEFYLGLFPELKKEEIIQLWNSVLKDFPSYRLKFIQNLALEKKYKLILLSNTNELHIDWVINNVPFYDTFKNSFDNFYLSHEIGLRKPDAAIFEYVLNQNHLKAKDCLFIDDTKEHILGASKLGIHTWNINPKTEDITNLFNVKNHLF